MDKLIRRKRNIVHYSNINVYVVFSFFLCLSFFPVLGRALIGVRQKGNILHDNIDKKPHRKRSPIQERSLT